MPLQYLAVLDNTLPCLCRTARYSTVPLPYCAVLYRAFASRDVDVLRLCFTMLSTTLPLRCRAAPNVASPLLHYAQPDFAVALPLQARPSLCFFSVRKWSRLRGSNPHRFHVIWVARSGWVSDPRNRTVSAPRTQVPPPVAGKSPRAPGRRTCSVRSASRHLARRCRFRMRCVRFPERT